MAQEGQDQNRSEEATPFKLGKARERGSVARGADLGFFVGLVALGGFMTLAGPEAARRLMTVMRQALIGGIASANDPRQILPAVAEDMWSLLHITGLFGATLLALVLLTEIIQLRGLLFSAHPLKPDFTRLNPATGLKRLFSVRILKESAKNVLKLAAYATCAAILLRAFIASGGAAIGDAARLSEALWRTAARLIWAFALLAFGFAILDQVLTRKAFSKQMRMSRREVVREAKEREGDPRLKRRRKQLHAEFAKQVSGMGKLAGADLVVVNPVHYAVALGYDRRRSRAPIVVAKARNLQALELKRRAAALGLPIFREPALARALFADGAIDAEIQASHYHAVAALYFRIGFGDAVSTGQDQ